MNKFKIMFLVMAITVGHAQVSLAKNYKKEENYSCGSGIGDCEAVTDALVNMVLAYGYKCDSVSNVLKWVMKQGFTIRCNNYSYTYDVEDRGGRWVLKLRD